MYSERRLCLLHNFSIAENADTQSPVSEACTYFEVPFCKLTPAGNVISSSGGTRDSHLFWSALHSLKPVLWPAPSKAIVTPPTRPWFCPGLPVAVEAQHYQFPFAWQDASPIKSVARIQCTVPALNSLYSKQRSKALQILTSSRIFF